MSTERLTRIDPLADLRRQWLHDASLTKEDKEHLRAQVKRWSRAFKGLVNRQRIYLLMVSYRRIRSGKLEPAEERLARQEMRGLLEDLDEAPTRNRGGTVPAGRSKRQIPRFTVARPDDGTTRDADDDDGDDDGDTDD